MNRIVVGVDGSEPSSRAVKLASELAVANRVPLHLVYVVPPLVYPVEAVGYGLAEMIEQHRQYGRKLLADASKGLPAGLTSTSELREGGPAEELVNVAEAQDAGIVVVGSTGRGAMGRLLVGSIADRLVHTCKRPVLVVR